MIKRVNFTGRRRIPRSRVDTVVFDGTPRRFSAAVNLANMDFPADAEVVLEATSAGSSIVERISCGVASQLQQPTNRQLLEVEGENFFFALKVIDRQKTLGRILGIAEQIRPERAGQPAAGGRRGILPIEPAELGQELWRLEFKDQDVILLVNKDVPGLKDRARCDPLFYATVYPEVVRRVLKEAILEDVDIDEDSERWAVLWLRFGRDLHPTKQIPPKSNESDDHDEWIDEVVAAFCAAHEFKAKYLNAMCDSDGEQS